MKAGVQILASVGTVVFILGATFILCNWRDGEFAKLAERIVKAPLVEPNQLAQYCGKKTVVKCQLYTTDECVAGNPFVFEKLYREGTSRGSTSWYLQECMPNKLVLTNKIKDLQVTVAGVEVEPDYMATIFSNNGGGQMGDKVPPQWLALTSDATKKYRVCALPLKTKVTVVGVVEQTDAGLQFTKWGEGIITREVIISTGSPKQIEARPERKVYYRDEER